MNRKADRAKILAVDDEAPNLKLLSALLEHEGYEVRLATGGQEALDLLGKEPMDLVLLDLMMPGVDGLAVLSELSKKGCLPSLPVVVVTALADRDIRLQALKLGAIDFITKPFDRIELASRIGTLIELRQLRDQAVEHARQQATERMVTRARQALESLPVLLYSGQVNDGEFRLEWILGNSLELMGFVEETYGDDDWIARVHPENRDDIRSTFTSPWTIGTGQWKLQYRWYHPNLGQRWMLTVGHFESRQRTVVGAHFDITETKALEQKFLQSQKMEVVGQLASSIAHDFNNLLAVIMSFATFARTSVTETQGLADLDEVLKASERAAGLTRQLLTLSRRRPSEKKATDVNERLIQLKRLLESALGEQIQLNLETCPEPKWVRIDPVQFDQLVLNLTVNARDAMPNGGVVQIKLGSTQPCNVKLEVRDSGEGMNEETQLRVFEPFFTTKELGRGTGLGLATCLAVVEEADGTIQIQSEPGEGTIFTIEFSLTDELESQPASQLESRSGDGFQVLIVEDEPNLLQATARVLKMAGYRTCAAANWNQAVLKLKQLGPNLDALVTDFIFPGGNGIDLIEQARTIVPNVKVILMTGYLDKDIEIESLHVHKFLWKPVLPMELTSCLGDVLGKSSSSGEKN